MTTRVAATVSLGMMVGLALLIFAYPLSALWWHLTLGDKVTFSQSRIFVPPRWTAHTAGNVLFIFRRPLTVFSRPSMRAMATLAPNSHPPSTDIERETLYRNFAYIYRTKMVRKGTILGAPILLGRNESEAYCMQLTPIDNPKLTDLACLIFGGRWRATFVGRTAELNDFYRIILQSSTDGSH